MSSHVAGVSNDADLSGHETNPLTEFHWTPQPQAGALIREMIEQFLPACPAAAEMAERMREETGTRFADWIDHIAYPISDAMTDRLTDAGFVRRSLPGADICFVQEQGIFPPVVLSSQPAVRLAIKVESVVDFLVTWAARSDSLLNVESPIEGEPFSSIRQCCLADGPAELWAIERHGFRGFDLASSTAEGGLATQRHLEEIRRRRRNFADDDGGFSLAERLVESAIAEIGVDRTCDLFFFAEREYWQRRNRAAATQKARQDRMGLGWANHDHHTYRSSRQHFSRLIGLFERLGFHCRERFYAGAQAGWGAQVLEQPSAGVVIFADVDLSPDELFGDFAHEPLPARRELGTVGLWCALHGEALLQAGMHHLECQFDFAALTKQLETDAGIKVMKPFTDFAYLRQAFTEGERWPVRQARIDGLLAKGQITAAQAAQFREWGAIGSHLENLERNAGFKGFNQSGVSEIIAATDPRRHLGRD